MSSRSEIVPCGVVGVPEPGVMVDVTEVPLDDGWERMECGRWAVYGSIEAEEDDDVEEWSDEAECGSSKE